MYTLNCNGRLLLIDRALVMGILNLTPDSFYSGSRVEEDAVLQRASQMIGEGADILDIGGQSTRPGSERISAEEEQKRVISSIRSIKAGFPEIFISIDTYHASVARAAVEAGADIINDVSSGGMDPDMFPTVADLGVPYILMHMKGHLNSMQQEAVYEDVTREVLDHLSRKKAELNKMGIKDVLVDPGFGFAKTAAHNFELLKNLSVFKILEAPLVLGLSRKSMVYRTLDITAEQALNGSTVLHTIGLLNGASIIRTHDVKETREAILLVEAMDKKK